MITIIIEDKSLIGRLYTPYDNSYSVDLTTGNHAQIHNVPCVITSEPFVKPNGYNGNVTMVRVKALTSGRDYEVMYCENCLISSNGKRYRDLGANDVSDIIKKLATLM